MLELLRGSVLPMVVLAIVASSFGLRPMSRHRLARFALRQRLELTPHNSPSVARYLATTRRWRASGTAIAAAAFLDWSFITGRSLQLNLIAVFVGWFAGAVVAEWRVAAPSSSERRMASLEPRRLRSYLGSGQRLAVALVWTMALASCAASAVVSVRQGTGDTVHLVALIGVQVASTAVLVLVTRRVLDRPQPLARTDMIEADDALRGRSLQVLAGSTLAINGYVGSAAVIAVAAPGGATSGIAGAVGLLFLPILGAVVALGPHRSSRQVSFAAAVAL